MKGAVICTVGIKLETWEVLATEEGVESRKQGSPSGHGLTWLQTGLSLSPGLFRIIPSYLELKLDTPMDLVRPASLYFSRAWGGRIRVANL